jgi:hypothetical protein
MLPTPNSEEAENGFGKFLRTDPANGFHIPGTPATKTEKPKRIYPTPEEVQAAALWQAQQEASENKLDPGKVCFAGSWTYPGDTYRVLRFNFAETEPGTGKTKKTYRPIHRNGAGWSFGDPSGALPLYLGDDLPADGPIFVLEGEKCADAARNIGLPAVASAHGGESAHRTNWNPLAGREVVIVPDNDDTGRKYARQVAAILTLLAPPAVVKIIDLPGLPEHGDIADALAADGVWDSNDDAEVTIMALAAAAPIYTPPATDPTAPTIQTPTASGPTLVCLADVQPEPVRWLWHSRIALGKLSVFAGQPDLGKSFVTLDMAARVSKGDGWPDNPTFVSAPGGVVLLSAEDDLADTIRPRLDAAGADVRRIHALTTVRIGVDFATGKPTLAPFNLGEHLPMLEAAIRQTENCRLVVIDPISAYLGQTDSHNNSEVRGVLAPLAELAARHRIAVVAVSHFNKGTGEAINRVMGSLGFVAAPRAAFVFAPDRDDPTGKRRFMLPLKNNLTADRAGLAYRLLSPNPGAMPAVAWETMPVSISVEDAVSPEDRRRGPEPEERREAAAWLLDFLAGGPMLATDCTEEAKRQGISETTLRRAKAACRVVVKKDGFQGKFAWRLPGWEKPFESDAAKDAHPALSQTT